MARPAVLMYHGFGGRTAADDPHNMFVPESALQAQLKRVAARGALDVDGFLAALSRRGPVRERRLLVTIDDGYESTLDVAAPLFAAAGVPALLVVPPGLLGGTSTWMPEMPHEPLIAADRLRELAGYGIEVGAHGFDHVDMRDLDASELRWQTYDARVALADLTGRLPRTFAYPRGIHDAAARAAVREAGYECAFSVFSGHGRFAIPRGDVNALDTDRTFALKCQRWYPTVRAVSDRAPAIRRALHQGLGRASR